MAWAEDLIARLTGATSAASRVSWYERGRDWSTSRSVVLSLDDEGRFYTHGGADGLLRPAVTIDCFGASGSEAEALAAELVAMVETPGVQVGGSRFVMGFVRGGRTIGPEDMPDGARVFRRRMIAGLNVEQV